MTKPFDVSVVISTFNRCEMLLSALESVVQQDNKEVTFELIVVDNSSTDNTAKLVRSFIDRGYPNVKYVYEGRKGLSYGRNAGIANSSAPLIAFTDDDVRVAPNWVTTIWRAFKNYPDVDFLGGKVLPRWQQTPPEWLTADIWAGPLALVDEGDEPFLSTKSSVFFFPGANFSFRRSVFEEIGLFDPRYQRIDDWVSSIEDSELILRVIANGGRGLYEPQAVVYADVQPDRMSKAYFRRWHSSRGRYRALLRLHEVLGPNGELLETTSSELRLFGSPAHLYRQCIRAFLNMVVFRIKRDHVNTLKHECDLRQSITYINQRWRTGTPEETERPVSQFFHFIFAFTKRKCMQLRLK